MAQNCLVPLPHSSRTSPGLMRMEMFTLSMTALEETAQLCLEPLPHASRTSHGLIKMETFELSMTELTETPDFLVLELHSQEDKLHS